MLKGASVCPKVIFEGYVHHYQLSEYKQNLKVNTSYYAEFFNSILDHFDSKFILRTIKHLL